MSLCKISGPLISDNKANAKLVKVRGFAVFPSDGTYFILVFT